MTYKNEKAAKRKRLRPHPARDQILDVMRSYGKPISPTQMTRITGANIGSTAYHMRELVSVGIAELADEGRVRGAVEHFYALVPGAHDDLQSVDPVEQLLGLCGALTVPAQEEGGYPRPAIVDDLARALLTATIERLRPKVRQIVAEAIARADGDAGADVDETN